MIIHAVTVEVVRAKLDGAAQNLIELHGVALRRHLPGKAQQILHDLLGALRFLQDDAQIFARRLRNRGIFHQQVGKPENRSERIIHFVRDAGNQLPYRRHFLGVD